MRASRASLVLVVWSMAAPLLAGVSDTPACPAPTAPRGNTCVLLADVELQQTLRLPSGTHLDCQGHRLTPAAAGALDDPRTTALEFVPSQPELAILMHRSYGTKVQACRIEGFDFGILVVDAKTPADAAPGAVSELTNKILGNVIDVRTNAIGLIRADNTLIAGNRLTYASERGRGIAVEFDSDENRIVGNTITSTDAARTGLVNQVPGGPLATAQTAIMDNEIHFLLGDRPLRNLVIDGHLPASRELIQVASGVFASGDAVDATQTDHNRAEGNTILDEGYGTSCTRDPDIACRSNADCPTGTGPCLLKQNSGVGFNVRASFNVVTGNAIGGPGTMERGVSFGGVGQVFTIPNFFPGTCSLDPTRLCADGSDCNLSGYDTASLGSCTGFSPITFNGNTLGLVAADNELTGAFQTAALISNNTDGFSVRGNLVQGDTAIVAGIRSGGTAINGTIERNVVSGAANALFLSQPPSGTLSLVVALNDFTGYATAIRTGNDFTAPTMLQGNYWGLPCPGLDPAMVRFENGTQNALVTDATYGVPVAATPDELLPPPCP